MAVLPPFQRFLEDHRDDVWRFPVAAVGRTDADDRSQDAFMAAMRAHPRLRPDSNLRARALAARGRQEAARGGGGMSVPKRPPLDRDAAAAAAARFAIIAEPDIAYALVDTPVGKIMAAQTKRGLACLGYVDQHGNAEHFVEELSTSLSPRILEAPARLDVVRRELEEYFEGKRHAFDLNIDLSLIKTPFAKRLLQATA